jgi:hypothetical protein
VKLCGYGIDLQGPVMLCKCWHFDVVPHEVVILC